MYSPPIPRTADAIFAKFSEPRNCLGLIMIKSSLSSKSKRASSSSGNDMRMSSTDLCFGAGVGVVGVVGVWGVGCVICPTASDFNDADTERKSAEIWAKTVTISSTFFKSWSSFSLSVLIWMFSLSIKLLNSLLKLIKLFGVRFF
jgi:hypothetical protein